MGNDQREWQLEGPEADVVQAARPEGEAFRRIACDGPLKRFSSIIYT